MTSKKDHEKFMARACKLALSSAKKGTGPFGCIIVKKGKIIAEGWNQVTELNDPSAHAEMQAIRKACQKIKDFQLTDCDIYTSSFPCPQCIGTIYWSRPSAVYYANSLKQAAKIGFDDEYIYEELSKPNAKRNFKIKKVSSSNSLDAFEFWQKNPNKIIY